MTDQHDPNLERTIATSLTQHSSRLGSSSSRLSDVMARVERRRNRRRSVAVVGSLAAITVGVLGIASVSGRSPDQIPDLAAAASSDMTAVQATDIAAYTDAWACQIPVTVADPQPDTQYFELCEPHELTSENPEAVPPTTGPECSSFVDTNPPIATATSTTTTIDPPNSDVLISTPVPTLAPIESACSYVEGIPTTTFVVSAVDSDEPIWIVEAGESWASISETFGMLDSELTDVNGWEGDVNHLLVVGDEVRIPGPAVPTECIVPATATIIKSCVRAPIIGSDSTTTSTTSTTTIVVTP